MKIVYILRKVVECRRDHIHDQIKFKLYILRKVVDAITGTDLAAFGEKLRENVVFQVLEWDSTSNILKFQEEKKQF